MDYIYMFNEEIVKQKYSDFSFEKSRFNNSAYYTYKSSYIKTSNTDNVLIRMSNKLDSIYKRIDEAYNNIDKWWSEYNSNVSYIENVLSGYSTSGLHSEDSVRSYIFSNLSEITSKKIDLSNVYFEDGSVVNVKAIEGDSTLSYVEQIEQYKKTQDSLYEKCEATEEELNNLLNKFAKENLEKVKDTVRQDYLRSSDYLANESLEEQDLINYFKKNIDKYVGEVPNEFKETFGISYDEYLYTLSYITYQKNIIDAQRYEIKQAEKSAPYYDILNTAEFLKYKDSYEQQLQAIVNENYEGMNISTEDGFNRMIFVDAYRKYGNLSVENDIFKNYVDISDYDYLTENERILYSYLYATENVYKAEEFKATLSDKINKQRGLDEANKFIESITVENALYDAVLNPTKETLSKLTDSDLQWLAKASKEGTGFVVDEKDVFGSIIKNYEEITKKSGKSAATQYLNNIEKYLKDNNQLLGIQLKDDWANYGKTTIKGVKDGIDSWSDSVTCFTSDVMTQNEYAQSYIASYLSDEMGLTHTYNISTGVGRMLPTMAISLALGPLGTSYNVGNYTFNTGQFAAQVFQGFSSFGSETHNSLVAGQSGSNAFIDGLASASSEIIIGSLLGSVPDVIKPDYISGSSLKSVLTEFVKDGLGEGAEEYVQTYVDAGYNALLYGEEINLEELNKEALLSFGYGMTIGMIFKTGDLAVGINNVVVNGKEVNTVDFMDFINKINKDSSINSNSEIDLKSEFDSYLGQSDSKETKISSVDNYAKVDGGKNLKSLDAQIDLANYYSSKGNFYTIPVESLDSIPSDTFSKINDPTKVNFKVGDKVYSYLDVKMNNIKDSSANVDSKSFESKIDEVNFHTSSGNTAAINVDNISDISIESLLNVQKPELTNFVLNNQKYSYSDFMTLVIEENIVNDTVQINDKNIIPSLVQYTGTEAKFRVDNKNYVYDTNTQSVVLNLNHNFNHNSDVTKRINAASKDIAVYFSDAKQYIRALLPELIIKHQNDSNASSDLQNALKLFHDNRINNINYNQLLDLTSNYISQEDLDVISNLESKNDSMENLLSIEEQHLIGGYTKAYGPFITAYLRQSVIEFGKEKTKIDGKNTIKIMESIAKRLGNSGMDSSKQVLQEYFLDENNADINKVIETFDNMMSKSQVKEDTLVYRCVNDLFLDGNKLATYDVGQKFNDQAYFSTSFINRNIFESKIMLEIMVPKGTNGVYLESVTGVGNYNQQELLLDRGLTYEITGIPEVKQGVMVIPVKVVPTEVKYETNADLKENLSEIKYNQSMNQDITSKLISDTTEKLNDDITERFDENITEKLNDDVTGKFDENETETKKQYIKDLIPQLMEQHADDMYALAYLEEASIMLKDENVDYLQVLEMVKDYVSESDAAILTELGGLNTIEDVDTLLETKKQYIKDLIPQLMEQHVDDMYALAYLEEASIMLKDENVDYSQVLEMVKDYVSENDAAILTELGGLNIVETVDLADISSKLPDANIESDINATSSMDLGLLADIYNIERENGFVEFSTNAKIAVEQMGNVFGDAGDKVSMFIKTMSLTPAEVMQYLTLEEQADFQNFLDNTKEGRFINSLTKEELSSLVEYTRNGTYGYETINGALREDNYKGLPVENHINNIRNAMEKYGGLDTDMKLYRGIGVGAFTAQSAEFKALFENVDTQNINEVYDVLDELVGKEFHDAGFMSASPSYNTSFAPHESCPIVLDISAAKGTKGAYINQISQYYNSENEFLLADNTKFIMEEVLPPAPDVNGKMKIVIKCTVVQ